MKLYKNIIKYISIEFRRVVLVIKSPYKNINPSTVSFYTFEERKRKKILKAVTFVIEVLTLSKEDMKGI